MSRDGPDGPHELSDQEWAAHKPAEREQLERPARERATVARQTASTDTTEAMSLLAEAFHILRGAPGVCPWDSEALYHFAVSASRTSAGKHAARFLLDVWNNSTIDDLDEATGEGLGHFSSVEAMACWDHGNRAAYATWVADLWWP